jgi:uncharacterized protein YoxC
MSEDNNGWGEYSRLVLNELGNLSDGMTALNKQIQELKEEIIELKAKEDRVEELRGWKSKIDEVLSPTQLKELSEHVTDLNLFKTKAVTVFAVIQFLMATMIWYTKVMG